MNKVYNILIAHNYYQIPGGEDTVVSNEKRLLEEHGHKVLLYTRNNTELKSMPLLHKLILPFTTLFNPKTFREVRQIIKQQNIQIVHVHNTLNLISPSIYYAAYSLGVPVIQTLHNFRMICPGATFYRDGHICEDCVKHGLISAIRHNCYRYSKVQTLACVLMTKLYRMTGIYRKIYYICLTEFNKEKLLLLNVAGKKPVITPDHIFIKPNFTYENTQLSQSRRYFLYIGRIETIKGIDILIQAFCRMPQEKLIIAGTGTELDKYKSMVDSLDAKNITFYGFANRKELNTLLSSAKAVVITSQWYETFGMIIAEAFSSGVPVIAGNIGNIGNLVKSMENGLKFQYNSPDALINAIDDFNHMDLVKMSNAAKKEYYQKYSPSNNYLQLLNIYKQIV